MMILFWGSWRNENDENGPRGLVCPGLSSFRCPVELRRNHPSTTLGAIISGGFFFGAFFFRAMRMTIYTLPGSSEQFDKAEYFIRGPVAVIHDVDIGVVGWEGQV